MNKIKSIFALALMGSGAFALISAGLFFLHLTRTADQLTKDSGVTLAALKDTATEAKDAIQDGRKQVKDLGRVMSTIWLHVDRVAGEAQREQKDYYATISKKTATVLDSADATIRGLNATQQGIASDFHANSGHLNTALDGIRPVLDGIPPVLEETNRTMAAAHVTLDSLNATVSDPSIRASLQNINTTTANVADSSGDIKVAVHRWTRPASVLKSLFTNLLGVGVKARAFF